MNDEDYIDDFIREDSIETEETADEMFKKLGYEKIGETENEITYVNEYDVNIIFNLLGESFCKTSEDEQHYYTDDIDMQELKAINKKCEELGWI